MTSLKLASRRLRDAIVLASFVPPVSLLLRSLYGIATWWIATRVGRLPFVRSVLLTGSVAAEDCVYGASDLDFIVLVEGREDRLFVKRALRARFRHWRRLFPIIGPVEERAHNVFFLDELDRDRYAAILKCRIKTGHSRTLYGAPAPELPAALAPDEVVAEIVLQLKSVAIKLLESDLNLYFWKAKTRVLLALCGAGCDWRDVAARLDPQSAAMLRTLCTTSNRRLFFNRSVRDNRSAWKLVAALCRHVVEIHGLRHLPSVSVAFRSTPAPQCAPPDMPPLPESIVPHALARDPAAFGGPLVLSTSGKESLLLELRDGGLDALDRGLHVGRDYNRARQGETLLWWSDYVFQMAGGTCVGVLSRWDSPQLFPESFDARGRLVFPERFLDLLLLERDVDLEYLKGFYWRLVEPETAATRPARHHEDSLRYFENRTRVVTGLAAIHLLRKVSRHELVNFGTVDQVFADAATVFPSQAPTLRQLATYAHALAAQRPHEQSDALPPGLLRAGIHFFGDRLYDREIRSDYSASRRLTLSLCVCTRNRADGLGALLESVARQSQLPAEVVIVDNGSTDHTRDVVQSFMTRLHGVPFRYVVDHSRTMGRLRNRAVHESAGDIICFTDDDCILAQGWFRNIEESFLLEDRIGAVGGRMCHYVEDPDGLVDVFHQEYLGQRL